MLCYIFSIMSWDYKFVLDILPSIGMLSRWMITESPVQYTRIDAMTAGWPHPHSSPNLQTKMYETKSVNRRLIAQQSCP